MPIGAMAIILMALNVFKPKLQKPAVIIYGILAIIFWIAMFGYTEMQYSAELDNELIDISHANVSYVVSVISQLSILIIDTGGFFLLAKRLHKENYPKYNIRKALMVASGWLLFVISGVLDSNIPPQSIGFIIIVRGLMIIAFNLIYLGFWSKIKPEESNSEQG